MSSTAASNAENEGGSKSVDDALVEGISEAIQNIRLDAKDDTTAKKTTDEKEEGEEDAPESVKILAKWIKSGECRRILVLTGAGISVSAGIPDFRTPGTGLYSNLQKYNLPFPEAVFDLDFYRDKPGPFCTLAKDIWPGIKYAPTITHAFLALLAEKGLMMRNYSQNIDGLEHLAGIPDELLIECHGHFRTASCTNCGAQADPVSVKDTIVNLGKAPLCDQCYAPVKPDIVFFGEGLPDRFHRSLRKDVNYCDLVLVMGTSLQVAPVSMIPEMVSRRCKRALINRDCVGRFRTKPTQNEIFIGGNCDDSIVTLAKLLGWRNELNAKHEALLKTTIAAAAEEEEGKEVDN